jgi:hypothetical protein
MFQRTEIHKVLFYLQATRLGINKKIMWEKQKVQIRTIPLHKLQIREEITMETGNCLELHNNENAIL